jgi:hypothetical protein
MSWFAPNPSERRIPTMPERAAAMGIPSVSEVPDRRCAACGQLGNPPASEVVLPDAPDLHIWADMLLCRNPTACREHCMKIGTWKVPERISS